MKILPDNWKLQPVGDICSEIVDCINKTASTVDGPTPYKMIRTTNVRHGRVSTDEVRYVDEKTYQLWTRRSVPKRNDIVLTREAPLGEIGLIRTDESLFLGQRTMMYRADEAIANQNYLYYAFQGGIVQGQIRSWGSGATVEHLRVPDASKFQVPVPPVKEQQKIAAILTAYDDLIENNRQRIALLEKSAEEIYREWFVRLRFPGHEHTPVHKGVPEGWEPVRLGDIYQTAAGGTPSRSESRYFNGEIPWVKTGELKQTFVFNTEERITEEAISNSSAKLLPAGTVVMAMYCAMEDVTILGTEAATNQACCALLSRETHIGPEFTYQQIKFAIREMTNWSHGAAQQNLSQTLIRAFPVFKPEKATVEKYCEIAHPLFELIKQLMKETDKLSSTRDLLLNRLISGKLRVDDMDIQFPPSMQEEAA